MFLFIYIPLRSPSKGHIKTKLSREQWLTPVILATQETRRSGGSQFK
jgi:hypothetical protein